MKKDIHPKYEMITANCSCGNSIQIRSATRSTLVSSVMLQPVAVLTASTSVSTSRAQNKHPEETASGRFFFACNISPE